MVIELLPFVLKRGRERKRVHLSIHLNLNPIYIFCTSKHFYNFEYFTAWIILASVGRKSFLIFRNNFPQRFFSTIFMCNKPQRQPSAIFLLLLCVLFACVYVHLYKAKWQQKTIRVCGVTTTLWLAPILKLPPPHDRAYPFWLTYP